MLFLRYQFNIYFIFISEAEKRIGIMRKKECNYKLTNREYDIMRILWTSEEPLTASHIAEHGENLSINTVQATLKKLLKRDLIHVDKIVYSGTVLSRAYFPSMTQEDFETQKYMDSMKRLHENHFSCSQFVASFLGQESDRKAAMHEIEQLEKLLAQKKQELTDNGGDE